MYSIKFQFYPTSSQASSIKRQLNIHKQLYNKCLEERKSLWENEKKSTTGFSQIKSLVPEFKNKGCNYSSLQQTVRRLDKSYNAFFKNGRGYPRFKKEFRSIDFGSYGDGWKIRKEGFYIQNIGILKFKRHRDIENPKHLTLVFDGEKYFICILCNKLKQIDIIDNKEVGIDLGMKDFVVTSEGEKFQHNTPYLKSLKKIKKQQSKYSKESKKCRKNKLRKRLNKIHRKIKNQRKDFLHKLSNHFVKNYSVVCIEDLNIKEIQGFPNFNRKKNDISWGAFIQMLSYKAESAGRSLIKVDPRYTTQSCIRCGHRQEKKLNERIHKCSCCNHEEDRDVMAAKNILAVGLHGLVLT